MRIRVTYEHYQTFCYRQTEVIEVPDDMSDEEVTNLTLSGEHEIDAGGYEEVDDTDETLMIPYKERQPENRVRWEKADIPLKEGEIYIIVGKGPLTYVGPSEGTSLIFRWPNGRLHHVGRSEVFRLADVDYLRAYAESHERKGFHEEGLNVRKMIPSQPVEGRDLAEPVYLGPMPDGWRD